MQLTITNIIPPPDGTGKIWELLELGVSRKLTPKNGINLPKRNHDRNPAIIETKNICTFETLFKFTK